MKKTILILFLCLLYASVTLGDTEPALVRPGANKCEEYSVCTAQTATGACTVLPASGDERVLDTFIKGFNSLTFFSHESVGNYSCDVFLSSNGFDASGGSGIKATSQSITQNNQGVVLAAAGFGHMWVQCATIATSVTMTVNACP